MLILWQKYNGNDKRRRGCKEKERSSINPGGLTADLSAIQRVGNRRWWLSAAPSMKNSGIRMAAGQSTQQELGGKVGGRRLSPRSRVSRESAGGGDLLPVQGKTSPLPPPTRHFSFHLSPPLESDFAAETSSGSSGRLGLAKRRNSSVCVSSNK
jgi:hypothetical protein